MGPVEKKRAAPRKARLFLQCCVQLGLALTGFEAWLCFVDHINAALAAHDAAVTVPALERAE